MARSPHPDDCRDALAQIRRRRNDLDQAYSELQEDLTVAIRNARAARLPATEIAELAGMSRTWLYAHHRDVMLGEQQEQEQ